MELTAAEQILIENGVKLALDELKNENTTPGIDNQQIYDL